MKTPEQIADEMLAYQKLGDSYTLHLGNRTVYGVAPSYADTIHASIVAAIEADRAQRVHPHPGTAPGKIAKRAAKGVKARWLRMGYTPAEASDVADEAKNAALRALREVGL